jgi:Flp pilus assembly protein TadG
LTARTGTNDILDLGSTVVEVVVLVPLLMLLVLAAVQFVLWGHAEQVVQLAAAEANGAATVYGGTSGAGTRAAESVLSGAGSSVGGARVVVRQDTTGTTSVRVTGTAPAVLPGLDLAVSASVVGPRQRFIVGAGGVGPRPVGG